MQEHFEQCLVGSWHRLLLFSPSISSPKWQKGQYICLVCCGRHFRWHKSVLCVVCGRYWQWAEYKPVSYLSVLKHSWEPYKRSWGQSLFSGLISSWSAARGWDLYQLRWERQQAAIFLSTPRLENWAERSGQRESLRDRYDEYSSSSTGQSGVAIWHADLSHKIVLLVRFIY